MVGIAVLQNTAQLAAVLGESICDLQARLPGQLHAKGQAAANKGHQTKKKKSPQNSKADNDQGCGSHTVDWHVSKKVKPKKTVILSSTKPVISSNQIKYI